MPDCANSGQFRIYVNSDFSALIMEHESGLSDPAAIRRTILTRLPRFYNRAGRVLEVLHRRTSCVRRHYLSEGIIKDGGDGRSGRDSGPRTR